MRLPELVLDRHATGKLIERIVLALVQAEQSERAHVLRITACGCGVAHGDVGTD